MPRKKPKISSRKVTSDESTEINTEQEVDMTKEKRRLQKTKNIKCETQEEEEHMEISTVILTANISETNDGIDGNPNYEFSCNICGLRFVKQEEVDNHMVRHKSRERQFTCEQCPVKFLCHRYLMNHIKRIHENKVKTYDCETCGKKLKTANGYNYHMLIHTGNLPHTCGTCGKGFREKKLLQTHMNMHTGNMPYKCNVCDKTFASLRYLSMHSFNMTDPDHEKAKIKPKLKVESKCVCNTCGKSFKSNIRLQAHVKIHSKENGYLCSYCGMEFKLQQYLKKHLAKHSGEFPFKCNQCEKAFRYGYSLITHRWSHEGKKPYKCKVCDKEFRHASGLMYHNRTHSGEKPFKCKVCEMAFTQSSHRNVHMRKQHAEETMRLGKDLQEIMVSNIKIDTV